MSLGGGGSGRRRGSDGGWKIGKVGAASEGTEKQRVGRDGRP